MGFIGTFYLVKEKHAYYLKDVLHVYVNLTTLHLFSQNHKFDK